MSLKGGLSDSPSLYKQLRLFHSNDDMCANLSTSMHYVTVFFYVTLLQVCVVLHMSIPSCAGFPCRLDPHDMCNATDKQKKSAFTVWAPLSRNTDARSPSLYTLHIIAQHRVKSAKLQATKKARRNLTWTCAFAPMSTRTKDSI